MNPVIVVSVSILIVIIIVIIASELCIFAINIIMLHQILLRSQCILSSFISLTDNATQWSIHRWTNVIPIIIIIKITAIITRINSIAVIVSSYVFTLVISDFI